MQSLPVRMLLQNPKNLLARRRCKEPPLSTTERSAVEAGPNASSLTKKEEEDLQHLKNLGINSYRMSISWSRLLLIK
ncbi:hypothetical protein JHK87_022117 [Glycine soja]|nr:hypothetical protein JHK87_022117 [Glycine soja]